MSKWISVKDKLPEDGETVLHVHVFKSMPELNLYAVGLYCEGVFYSFETVHLRPPEWQTTHWMPLPEPPGDI